MVLFLYSTGAYWLATTRDNVVNMTSNNYNICQSRFMSINIIMLSPYKEVVHQTTVADTHVFNKGMGQQHWGFCNCSTKITNEYKWFMCYDTHLHTPECHHWPCSHLHSCPHTLPAACRIDCCTAHTCPDDCTLGTWRDTLRTQQDTLWTQYDTYRTPCEHKTPCEHNMTLGGTPG